MASLFAAPKAKRRVLPPAVRRKIVDLKAEHPPLNLEEIANICARLFGRRPDGHTVKSVLEESAIPRRLADHFFAKTETWEELVSEHDLWLERHNTQRHRAHEGREDGRRSPSEVLGPVRVVRHHPTSLGPSSQRCSCVSSMPLAMRESSTGGCTRKKGSPAERSPCGWGTGRWR